MTTAVFLQVRLDSFRLPGKALLSLSGKTVIEHAMASLSGVNADCFFLLTDNASAPVLSDYISDYGFDIFAGPKDDVLLRFAQASRECQADRIIRATGDNPLVSCELANTLLNLHELSGADFSGYIGPPLGTGVEIVETPALLKADNCAVSSYEREHVSPYLYNREKEFRILRPEAPLSCVFKDSKVTLDTQDDFSYLSRIFSVLYRGRPIKAEDLVTWLKSEAEKPIPVKERKTEDTFSTVCKNR